METNKHFTAFAGSSMIATGELKEILAKTKEFLDSGNQEQVLIFDDETGRNRDFNMRGTLEEVLEQAMPSQIQPKGPGRPKLGVVSGEVSLLPRHWEWLNQQPQKASGTIRRLIEAAIKAGAGNNPKSRLEAADRFMWVVAGNFSGCEEASRALYAKKWPVFETLISPWPQDVRKHLLWLTQEVKNAEEAAMGTGIE
jgi:uncharacterized protein